MNKLKTYQVVVVLTIISLTVSLLWFINASVANYSNVHESWDKYSKNETKIVETLLRLNKDLGYGGMIHNYKNYVIRGDDRYLSLFNNDVAAVKASLSVLESLSDNPNPQATAFLLNIEKTVNEYVEQVAIVPAMREANTPIADIDLLTKVSDEKALGALESLRDQIAERSRLVQEETSAALDKSNAFQSNGSLFSIPLVILMLLLFYYIRRIQSSNNALIKAYKWVDTLLDNAPEATICSNANGEIIRVNEQAESLFGYSQAELVHMSVEQLIPKRFTEHHSSHRNGFFKNPSVRNMSDRSELFALRKGGKEVEVSISLSVAETGQERIAIATVRDVSELRKTARELAYQASHDGLTGLMNRSAFEKKLSDTTVLAQRTKQRHALCFLDLDQFKVVNDTSGHAAGDAMLNQIGLLLTNAIRETDVVARLGGDEFAILMNDCPMSEALNKSREIISLVEDLRFPWMGRQFAVGVSIGVSEVGEEKYSYLDVLKHADIACFAAKDAGRNRAHLYQDEDEKLTLHDDEMTWVERINNGLKNNSFCLFAQEVRPIDGSAGYSHYELLIRLKDEAGNVILPGAFLPTAERYSLITKIDYWVLNAAFDWLAINADKFPVQTHFSINLSGQSLGDEQVLKYIASRLGEGKFPPSKVQFEVTETMAIANLVVANVFISTIKEYGCGFSLDDFGSGLSSFGYLKNLNVDILKIDGLFVKDILDDPIDFAMVESINKIGHVMGLETIAEFVENDEVARKLTILGVDYLQGYGIHKPTLIDDVIPKS